MHSLSFRFLPLRRGAACALGFFFAGLFSLSAFGVPAGAAFCWGVTGAGNKPYPTAIPPSAATTGKTFIGASAGSNYDLVLASDGTVYGWGLNTYGCLGNGTTTTASTPVAVNTSGAMAGKTITAIAAGTYHALALASDGTVFAWGHGIYGQLGNNTTVDSTVPVAVLMSGALAGKTVIAIAAGLDFSMALTSDHLVFTWGNASFSVLGNDPSIPGVTGHVPVAANYAALSGKTFTAIAAGVSTAYALGSDGHVYAWGYNVEGEVGIGTSSTGAIPSAVTTTGVLAGKTVVAIAGGAYNALALTSDGGLYSWGYNTFGSVGDGTTTTRYDPVAVDMSGVLAGKTVTAISAGVHCETALTSEGKIYSWGYGDNLGNGFTAFGTPTVNSVPIAVNMSSTPGQLGLTSDLFGQTVVTLGAGPTGAQGIVIAQAAVVVAAPVITTQPANQTVNVGASATFTVVASGSSLTYQWSKGGAVIAGATSASYTIPSAALTDAGSYTVAITNSGGTVTSNAATLTVNVVAPVITTQPANLSVNVGTSATFTVVASGSSLSYQWSKAGMPIGGATSSSYTIASAALSDAGSFTVTVTNGGGSVTSNPATLTVNAVAPPVITLQPVGQTVPFFVVVTLNVTATGSGLSYQWYQNGVVIAGATTSSLATGYAGDYSVIVSNGGGSVTSSIATLVFVTAPVITTQPLSQTAFIGNAVTLSVTATGGVLTYQWYKSGVSLAGETNSTLSFVATTAKAGSYTVIVNNLGGGVSSSAATLTVVPVPPVAPPVITTQPVSQTVLAGTNVTLAVAATGSGPLSYQWYKSGVAVAGETNPAIGFIASAASAGGYTVIITNAGGGVSSTVATVTVFPAPPVAPPVITTQPVSRTVPVGDPVALSVTATGSGPLSYQWYKSGLPLAGETNPTFNFIASTANAGGYTVIITNAGGGVSSTVATVTVFVPPVTPPAITVQPVSQTVLSGSAVTFSVTATGSGLSYQWYFGGVPVAGATGSTLSLVATPANEGNYSVIVTNSGGSLSSVSAALTLQRARLVNAAIRGPAGIGADSLIMGFVIAGPNPKTTLIRGVGPALIPLGIPNAVLHPQLVLWNSANTVLATNAGWGGTAFLTSAFAAAGAFPLPAGSDDCALLQTLTPSAYTAQVVGTSPTVNVALVEAYDTNPSDLSTRLINASGRAGNVGNGGNQLIAGFVVAGSTNLHVLVRGIGPALAGFGVVAPLVNPVLTVYDNGGRVIASNDDWNGTATLAADFVQAGAFGLTPTSKDAALDLTLAPGAYTAVVSSADASTGVALVEIYSLP